MEFIRSLTQLRPRHYQRGGVATIGNFDGVHRGHQTVLQQVLVTARQLQLPSTVIIFEPQPQEFFAPTTVPARLTRLREKILAMQRYAIDQILCLRFNAEFATWSASEFIQRVLVEGIQVQHLVVGDDFRFGQARMGNFATLQQAGGHYGFTIDRWQTFILDGERVSSTRIREALAQGNLNYANLLLGRPYTLCGRVTYGQQRGRSIGFPTANIFLHRQVSPLSGVFAVKVHGLTVSPWPGVANLGTRPTIGGQQLLLEVHLFDFDQSIYGHAVEVEFIAKLREEQRFDSFESLQQQIQKDVQVAKTKLFWENFP